MTTKPEGAATRAADDGGLDVDISTMTRDELIAHNLKVVDVHFHNENPETIDQALAVYGPEITWEAPARGLIYRDAEDVKNGYLGIFTTVHWNRSITLRRFATENFVFDDQIADLTVVGKEMPNLPFKPGQRISMRLIHCFEMKDGKIAREIAYEISRAWGGPLDNDEIPAGAVVTDYPDGPDFGKWK